MFVMFYIFTTSDQGIFLMYINFKFMSIMAIKTFIIVIGRLCIMIMLCCHHMENAAA